MAALYGDFVLPEFLAEQSDYEEWTSTTAPDNITQLLRWATSVVLEATQVAYYDVDPTTGLATDALIAQTMTNMTCAQAAAASAFGFDPNTGVFTPSIATSKKIGTASIAYEGATLAASTQAAIASGCLTAEAERLGRMQNLLVPNPWVFG